MKSKHKILINLFFVVFVISLLAACNRIDNPVFQSNNWETVYQNNDLDLFSIKFLDKNNGYVFGGLITYTRPYWQLILTTTDGGHHWTSDTSKLSAMIYGGIFPLNKENILGIGDHAYKSSNTGKTWTDVSPQLFSSARTFGSYAIDSITWIVTQSGLIHRTSNAGQTWETVYSVSPDGDIFENFTFPSSLVGYASSGGITISASVGYSESRGYILKTTDGGQSWAVLNPEPWKSNGTIMPYINALQFITDQIGYIATYDSKLYKTVNGGNNWLLIHNNHYSNGLEHFISEKIGYYSDGITVYVTDDGGRTWEVDYFNDIQGSDILYWTFLKTGQGYALTRDHRIIKKMY